MPSDPCTPRTAASAQVAIIFGAGASVPPLLSQQDLVEKLLRAASTERVRPAKLYLQRTFGGLQIEKDTQGLLRFEDIVGPLEIAESEEYWFHFGGHDISKERRLLTNRRVLDSLDTWLAISLDPPGLPRRVEGDPESTNRFDEFYRPRLDSPLSYSRLIAFLKQVDLLSSTVFVSMNYDILLDRALIASDRHYPDYHLEDFVKDPSVLSKRNGRNPVSLLKLHGSLNWRMCENCHLLRDTEDDVVWPESQCNDCGSKFARPMLIRPTLLKDFRHRVWRDLWRKAGHVLRDAASWIFVGYSLPMADVWMLRLLAQSARSGKVRKGSRRVIVVNPDSVAARRFRVLFPSAVAHEVDFAQWVSDCIGVGSLQ